MQSTRQTDIQGRPRMIGRELRPIGRRCHGNDTHPLTRCGVPADAVRTTTNVSTTTCEDCITLTALRHAHRVPDHRPITAAFEALQGPHVGAGDWVVWIRPATLSDNPNGRGWTVAEGFPSAPHQTHHTAWADALEVFRTLLERALCADALRPRGIITGVGNSSKRLVLI